MVNIPWIIQLISPSKTTILPHFCWLNQPFLLLFRRALLLFGTLGLFLRSATWCSYLSAVALEAQRAASNGAEAAPEPVTLGAPAEKNMVRELPVLIFGSFFKWEIPKSPWLSIHFKTKMKWLGWFWVPQFSNTSIWWFQVWHGQAQKWDDHPMHIHLPKHALTTPGCSEFLDKTKDMCWTTVGTWAYIYLYVCMHAHNTYVTHIHTPHTHLHTRAFVSGDRL